jgi:hypothetical protein
MSTPSKHPIKLFLINKYKWNSIRVFESYPNILTGIISKPSDIRPILKSLNSIGHNIYPKHCLVVDNDKSFLDECDKIGNGEHKLFINYRSTDEYHHYNFDTGMFVAPSLLFLPHVIYNIEIIQEYLERNRK